MAATICLDLPVSFLLVEDIRQIAVISLRFTAAVVGHIFRLAGRRHTDTLGAHGRFLFALVCVEDLVLITSI